MFKFRSLLQGLNKLQVLQRVKGAPFLQLRFSSQLKKILEQKILCERERIKKFRAEWDDFKVDDLTVKALFGGMRDLRALICETSRLDPMKGIRYREHTIFDLRETLPTAEDGEEPLPEGVLWLLMTGDIPTEDQVRELSCELARRGKLPKYLQTLLSSFPNTMHPMTQFSCAVGALNHDSKFVQGYRGGMKRTEYWSCAFEDALDLIAKMPFIASHIYKNTYRTEKGIMCLNEKLDWSANLTQLMGFKSDNFTELIRLYMTLHADHTGGNVTAHTTHLVGSALSDPFLAYSAGLHGLAGPLHGLANQEVLIWLKKLIKKIGFCPTDEELKEYVSNTLKSGSVIPGYGHAVLRKTDPRYIVQREFAQKHLADDQYFILVSRLFEIVPDILKETGKVRNPYPNVDGQSGVLLLHYGLKEMNFYTVLFGVARALGCMAQLVWDRALMAPIERPKSITTCKLEELLQKLKCEKEKQERCQKQQLENKCEEIMRQKERKKLLEKCEEIKKEPKCES